MVLPALGLGAAAVGHLRKRRKKKKVVARKRGYRIVIGERQWMFFSTLLRSVQRGRLPGFPRRRRRRRRPFS